MTDGFLNREFISQCTFYVETFDQGRPLWDPHSSHPSRSSADQQATDLAHLGHRVRVVMEMTNRHTLYEVDGKFNKLLADMEVNSP